MVIYYFSSRLCYSHSKARDVPIYKDFQPQPAKRTYAVQDHGKLLGKIKVFSAILPTFMCQNYISTELHYAFEHCLISNGA